MPPVSVMVKPVSGLCTMRCSYCFYADEMAGRETPLYAAMTHETLENLIRRVFAYAEGQVNLAFQGGEPTLAGADFYRDLLALEHTYNSRHLPVMHALQTNGLFLSDELLSVLKQGRFLLGVSVDGTKDIHDSRRVDAAGKGTFDRVRANLDRLKKNGMDFNILCVVDNAVAREPDTVFRTLQEYRWLQFIPCLDPLNGPEGEPLLDAKLYGEFLIRIYDLYASEWRGGRAVSVRTLDNWVSLLLGGEPESCGMTGCCTPNFLVESSGNVYPCDFYALDEWLLGNVNETSLRRMARSENARRFLDRSFVKPAACTSCRWASLCRGGCARDREAGGVLGENRLCESYRIFFDARGQDLAKLAAVIRDNAGRMTE